MRTPQRRAPAGCHCPVRPWRLGSERSSASGADWALSPAARGSLESRVGRRTPAACESPARSVPRHCERALPPPDLAPVLSEERGASATEGRCGGSWSSRCPVRVGLPPRRCPRIPVPKAEGRGFVGRAFESLVVLFCFLRNCLLWNSNSVVRICSRQMFRPASSVFVNTWAAPGQVARLPRAVAASLGLLPRRWNRVQCLPRWY